MKKIRTDNRIREIRKKKKMTLEQRAGIARISIAYLSDIEIGNRRGSAETIERIAAGLGVNPSELRRVG